MEQTEKNFGHPDFQDVRPDVPPLLGLIESDDAGKSWQSASLLGRADFHVLRAARERIFGFDSTGGKLLVSTDGGGRWTRRAPPEPLLDLAPHPDDPERLVATGEKGAYASPDGGGGWRPLGETTGLLAWPRADALVLVDPGGTVHRSGDGGGTFEEVGGIDGTPAALAAEDDDLYVALHTNEVKISAQRTMRFGLYFIGMATTTSDPALRAELAHGLSDESRQRILDLLRSGERRVSDVVEATGLSQPNVSKHLRCLRGCGLVVSEKRGREVFYALADGLDEVLKALDELLERVAPQMAACELTDVTLECCP